MTVGAVAGVALGVTLPIGMVAGLLIGLGSGAILHLVLGSPAGRLTLEQIATALGDLGVEASDLRHAPLEPTGVTLVEAVAPDGKQLLVKVYGRDAWDGQFLASLWGSLWNRGERTQPGVQSPPAGGARGVRDVARGTRRRLGPAHRRGGHGDPARRLARNREHRTGPRERSGNTRSATTSCKGSGERWGPSTLWAWRTASSTVIAWSSAPTAPPRSGISVAHGSPPRPAR